jgi:hypothetical protein
VLLGDNAQGKTNILEAIYLMATLRSFRGVGSAQMIRHGQKGYFVGGKVVGQGEREIKMFWSSRERKLTLDGAAGEEAVRLSRHAADGLFLHGGFAAGQRHGAHAAAVSGFAAVADAAGLSRAASALHAGRPVAQCVVKAICAGFDVTR